MEMEPWDPLDHPARIEVRRQGVFVMNSEAYQRISCIIRQVFIYLFVSPIP